MDSHIRQQMITLLPRLRRFAYSLTGTAADGDDLVQATCERAIGNLDKWQPDTRLDSWMFRIAQNLHFNAVRDRKNRDRLMAGAGDMLAPMTPAPEENESPLTRILLRQSLDALPEEQRCVLLLVCIEGYSYAECADILGIAEGTVTSRVARGRRALQARLCDDPDASPLIRRIAGR